MNRVQFGAAGVALVGASVIAIAPVAPPTAPAKSVAVPVAMTASYTQAPPELLALSAQRVVEGLAAAPLNPLIMAVAIAGNDRELLYAALRQSIDGPLWAIDPALEAFADILPDELGGGSGNESTTATDDGALLQFRNNVLWRATERTRTVVADALGVDPNLNTATVDTAAQTGSIQQAATTSNRQLRKQLSSEAPKSAESDPAQDGTARKPRPKPVRAAVTSINQQMKAASDRIDRSVKRLTTPKSKKNEADESPKTEKSEKKDVDKD